MGARYLIRRDGRTIGETHDAESERDALATFAIEAGYADPREVDYGDPHIEDPYSIPESFFFEAEGTLFMIFENTWVSAIRA